MKKPIVKQRLVIQIMKITLFQLVLAFVFSSGLLASSIRGQSKLDTKITIALADVSLNKALSKIEKSANVKFSYNSRICQLNKKVTIDANDETLSNLLNSLLRPLKVEFMEVNGHIVLQNETAFQNEAFGLEYLVNPPPKTIKGKVTDDKGIPLPGALVAVKGTKVSVVTDMDGNFSIEVPADGTKLVVSYLGMESREVSIGTSPMTIVLNEIGQKLNEVVVTTGYEKTSKRTFTGAISKITEKDLKVEGVVDISRMIEGKAAGVTVQNVTGTFGTAPKIVVRGASSIFGDTKPLWVIDGIVQEDIINITFADLASGNSATLLSSAIAGLNASDVSSIEILKDASATSIYGSRSMNGVVVVTTKQGRRDTPLSVTYSLEQTMRMVPSYSQYDILNSQETMSVLKEIEAKGFLELPTTAQGRYGGVYNIMARALNTYNPATDSYVLKNDALNKNAFLRKYELANTNWFNLLFRPSITQNHSLSFIGGGKNNTLYASLGFYDDPGWTIADKVNQFTTNIKNTFFLNDKLSVSLSTQASVRDQNAPGTYESNSDLVNGGTTRDFDINPFNYVLTTNRTLRPYDDNGNLEYYRANWAPFNILNELKNNYMKIKVKDIRFQTDLEYKINPNLTYNFTANARYATTSRDHNILENSNVVKAYNAYETTIVRNANTFLYKDPDDLLALKVSVLPNGGILRKFTDEMTSFNIRNSFTYKKTVNERHEWEGFLGQELRYVDRNSDSFSGFGLQYDRGLSTFTDPRIMVKLINGGQTYFGLNNERERTLSLFGKITYTYNRRYTGSLTGRLDGSNRQGESTASRWLPTYTLSGKWNIKEENFLKDNEIWSAFNLRASHGLTATPGPATNSLAIYRSYITNRENHEDRESSLAIEDLQNKNLTFEKQFETNLGLEIGFLDNRFQLTTDVYNRKAFDLIDRVMTSGIGGQKLKQGNNADMHTKGLEIALTTKNLINTKLKWSTAINFSIYHQEITRLQNIPNVFELVTGTGGNIVGNPRNTIYSYHFTGLNNQGLPTFLMANGEKDKIAGARFQDTDKITQYLKYEGTVEPNKSIGFSNTFSYENLSLNIFVVASGGNKVRLYPNYSTAYSDLTVYTKEVVNRWLNPGDEAHTNIPVIADMRIIANYNYKTIDLERAYSTYNYSDERVADGSFIRLKNVSLTYEFPKDLKKKYGLTTFNLKGIATNPLLIYSDKKLNGQDPEFFRSGGVAMPITSQYTFAISVSF